MQMKLSDIGEFGLIGKLRNTVTSGTDVTAGIGDDCAVLRSGRKGYCDLLTVDTLVEGVHFKHDDPPSKIGRKAMAVNISDVAAMGGIPKHAVVSLCAPPDCRVARVTRIYRGMQNMAGRYSVRIVGGDTVKSPGPLVITVALTGTVEKQRIALRSGARPGDIICVTGTLGGSIFSKHLAFTPRVEEARYLVRKSRITSMIDMSDGLASDLRRILEESRAGAEIRAGSIPVSAVAKRRWKDSGKTPLDMALTDGEDFELLFTVPAREVEPLLLKWRKQFRLPLTVIGEITKQKGLRIMNSEGNEVRLPGLSELSEGGYDHFG